MQVMGESFWRIAEGPNLWAATLRWLCFSDSTLPLAAREANRLLRQLSLGGPAQLRAGLDFAFEVCSPLLAAGPLLGRLTCGPVTVLVVCSEAAARIGLPAGEI